MPEIRVGELEGGPFHHEADGVLGAHDVALRIDPRSRRHPVLALLDAERPHGVETRGHPRQRGRVVLRAVGDDERGLRRDQNRHRPLGEEYRIEHHARIRLPALQLAAERQPQRQQGREHDRARQGDVRGLGVRAGEQGHHEQRVARDEIAGSKPAQVALEPRVHPLESQGSGQGRAAHGRGPIQRAEDRDPEHQDVGHVDARGLRIDRGRCEADLLAADVQAIIGGARRYAQGRFREPRSGGAEEFPLYQPSQ